jgi:GWxTD domain-containing protein
VPLRCRIAIALALLLPAVSSCASGPRLTPGSREEELAEVLSELASKTELRAFRRAAGAGTDSLNAFLERFWAVRDPTPGTPANEFRDRFLARLEVGRRQFGHQDFRLRISDDRLAPFVFFGPPKEVETQEIGPNLRYEYWIWRPDPRAVLAGKEERLLGELEFTVGFAVGSDQDYHRSGDTSFWSPPPPRLKPKQREQLGRLLADPSHDRFLRAAALFRLDLDRDPASLGLVLRQVADPDGFVREAVAEALQPLQVRLFPDGTFTAISTSSEIEQVRDWVAIRPTDPNVRPARSWEPVELDPFTRANMLTSVYDPAGELSPFEVERLRRERSRADTTTGRVRGWLTPEEARALYTGPLEEARSLLDAGGGEQAHALLEPLLRTTLADDAEAWHLDALALLASAEPGGRRLAEERVREAMRRDPDNVRYHLTLARIYKARTLDRYADTELERLLAQAPALADAYALRGVLRLEAYWAKGWRAGGWGRPIDTQGMPMEVARALALEQLHKALVLEPDNAFAGWWLGLHYLSLREWTTVVPVMSYLVGAGVHVPEALLGRGLAFQHLGLFEQAWADYRSALARLSAGVRAIVDDPRWVLPPSQGGYGLGDRVIADPILGRDLPAGADTSASLEADLRRAERDRFWRAKDQLFATALNERMLEQYRRFAYVTWHFANPSLGLRGWETHRGRVYLRYGEPLSVNDKSDEAQQKLLGRANPNDQSGEFEAADLALFAARMAYEIKETWHYPDLVVNFSGGNVSGEVTVSRPGEYAEGVERRPESERVAGMRPVLPIPATWFRFLDAAGRPEFVAAALAPPLGVQSGRPLPPGPEAYPVNLILLDADWNPVRRVEAEMSRTLRRGGYRPTWVGPVVTLPESVPAAAAVYAALEVPGEGDIPAYAARDTLGAPLGEAGLRLSDLVIASNIAAIPEARNWPERSYFVRRHRAIRPLPEDRFGLGEPLLVYLEIYGLAKDEIGATGYQVAFTVTMLDDRRAELPTVEGLLGKLVGSDRRQGSVTLRFDYEDILSDTSTELRVVFPTGRFSDRYRIEVEVTDKISGARAAVARVLAVAQRTGR